MMGGFVIKSALQDGQVIENKISSKDSIELLFKNTEVIIDFSCPIATESMISYILDNELRTPLVIGTTGLSSYHKQLMEKCSSFAPIFYAPNMSVLVSLMNMIVYALGRILDEQDFDAEIFDIHHRMKKDAPSGTAIMLGKTIARARNRNFDEVANFLRYGIIEQRRAGEIGFAVQRCGNVIGQHEVSFIGDYENLHIKHEANSKEIFAKGAVKAAKWIVKQRPGIYNMNNFTKDAVMPVVKALYKDFFAGI